MIQYLKEQLPMVFNREVSVLPPIPIPPQSYDSKRQQCLSTEILKAILDTAPQDENKILGVTEMDLFIPIFTYIFGEAQLGGRAGLISLARLKPDANGESLDEELYRTRALKEAVHELGHNFGLKHCPEETCVMHFANNIIEVDAKDYSFCPSCSGLITVKDSQK